MIAINLSLPVSCFSDCCPWVTGCTVSKIFRSVLVFHLSALIFRCHISVECQLQKWKDDIHILVQQTFIEHLLWARYYAELIVFLKYLFIYLFMAVLDLRFCARAFSSCGRRGPLFVVVHGPLTIAASLVAEHRLQTRRFSNCGSRAQLLQGMWDLPRPGLEPVSPALAGGFSITAPPGKPPSS